MIGRFLWVYDPKSHRYSDDSRILILELGPEPDDKQAAVIAECTDIHSADRIIKALTVTPGDEIIDPDLEPF